MAKFRSLVIALLVISLSSLGVPLPAQAGMISTEAGMQAEDRVQLNTFLDRAEVRAQLVGYGVDPSVVKQRVAALTDEEANELARRMDTLPAGGIIGLILTVFVILLITDILGLTKIFPFTKPIR